MSRLRIVGPGDPSEPAAPEARAALPEVPPGMRPLCALRDGEPVAVCALSLVAEMQGAAGLTGVIGAFRAPGGAGEGAALLSAAADHLFGLGARRVIGPMDGSTWMRYRLPLPEPGTPASPPFLGEPDEPPEHVEAFREAGFTVAAEYESRLDAAPGERSARAREREGQLGARGIGFRPLEPHRFEDELRVLHALSLESFADNLFYTPLDWESFHALYEPFRARLDPSLVILAEREGEALGFVFGYPDLLDPRQPSPRVVLKTLAVRPSAQGLGLGSQLTELFTEAAARRGAPEVIHALMAADNRSVRVSAGRRGELLRRYLLFGRGELPAR